LSFISNFGVVIPWVMLLTIEWIGLMLTTILGVATTLALTKKKIKTDTIHTWLKKVGFKNIKLLDTTKTTPQEQRATHSNEKKD
jgi:hypothetical protein